MNEMVARSILGLVGVEREAAKDRQKRQIRCIKPMSAHHIHVFISHSWTYSQHYEKLEEWIFHDDWHVNGVPIHFHDQSVPEDNPIHYAANAGELKSAIWDKILHSDVVVIPTGMYAGYSDCIQKEID